jgi:2-iminobutanoate/2-iminopropanoate deaminase
MSPPIGPYTPIVRAGPWLICSGQLGLQPSVSADAPAQLTQALANAEALLRGQGAAPEDVVKTTVFVTDAGHFPAVNEAYVAFFGSHRPARSMVAVSALPAGAAVEVEVWAYAPLTSEG